MLIQIVLFACQIQTAIDAIITSKINYNDLPDNVYIFQVSTPRSLTCAEKVGI